MMSRFGRVPARLIKLVVTGLVSSVLAPVANAQQPPSVDTAAVLAALAEAWTSRMSIDRDSLFAWYVRSDDSLTLEFAAAIKQPTKPAPPRLVCSFGAPAGTSGGLLTYVKLEARSPTSVLASVAHSCAVPDERRAFYQADYYEVTLRDGKWTARYIVSEIT